MTDAVLEQPPSAQSPLNPATRPLTSQRPFRFTADNARLLAARSVAARAAKRQLANPSGQSAVAQPVGQATERKTTVVVVAPLPRKESAAISANSDKVRELLAKSLADQASVMARKKPRGVGSITGRDGTAQGTKTLADAAATVFGWGDTTPGGLVMVGEVERAMDQPAVAPEAAVPELAAGAPGGPALDVPASAPEPAVVPAPTGCGVPATP